MPELPDVENYARFLEKHGLSRRIDRVAVSSTKVLKGISAAELGRSLRGHKLERARRHGKHLLAALDDGRWLTFHFGMAGRFDHFRDGREDPRHARLRLDFEQGEHLAYVDPRQLGRVEITADAADFLRAKNLGPDAMSLDEASFLERLRAKRGAIKNVLMDQGVLAGIGNLYSDEMLYQAKLHPRLAVEATDEEALKRLYRRMRRVLQTAIEKGAGTEDFERRVPKSWLLARRKKGADCPRCGGAIMTLKTNSRTAYYCPACQPDARDSACSRRRKTRTRRTNR